MAFRYINPGYASLLNTAAGNTVQDTKYNTVNGVSIWQTDPKKGVLLPENATELYIKCNTYCLSGAWPAFRLYAGNQTGFYLSWNSGWKLNVWYNKAVNTITENMTTHISTTGFTVDKMQAIWMHIKEGDTNGIYQLFVDGKEIYSYTGKLSLSGNTDYPANLVVMESDNSSFMYSNIIISDQPIALNEQVYIVPAKSVETTWIKDDAGNYNTDTAGAELLQIPDMSSFPGGNNITGIAIAADGVTGTTPITGIFMKDGAETPKGTLTPTASALTSEEVSWTETMTATELANRKFGWKAGV